MGEVKPAPPQDNQNHHPVMGFRQYRDGYAT